MGYTKERERKRGRWRKRHAIKREHSTVLGRLAAEYQRKIHSASSTDKLLRSLESYAVRLSAIFLSFSSLLFFSFSPSPSHLSIYLLSATICLARLSTLLSTPSRFIDAKRRCARQNIALNKRTPRRHRGVGGLACTLLCR